MTDQKPTGIQQLGQRIEELKNDGCTCALTLANDGLHWRPDLGCAVHFPSPTNSPTQHARYWITDAGVAALEASQAAE